VVFLLGLPGVAAAHSELESANPADGAVLDASPPEIVLTFSETLDPQKSSISLRDASGAEVAGARVDPDDDTVMRFTPPTLAPGAYEIRWTSVAEDGDLLRGTVHFEVAAAEVTSSPTAEPSESPSAVATASAGPTTAPSPSPSAAGGQTASSSDVILPILAAIVLIAVLGAWLLRNRARGARP
jgi:methionine-rich copper-binding protein CopC